MFELTNLFGNLSSRGYSKTIKGDFVVFIMKKKQKIRWKKLHGENMSVLRKGRFNVEDNHLTDSNKFKTGGFSGKLLILIHIYILNWLTYYRTI